MSAVDPLLFIVADGQSTFGEEGDVSNHCSGSKECVRGKSVAQCHNVHSHRIWPHVKICLCRRLILISSQRNYLSSRG
jgi:hypothetical protein